MWFRCGISTLSVSMDTMVLRQSSEVSMGTVRNGALISIVSFYTCTLSLMPRSLEFSGTSHPIIRNKKNMAFPTSHGTRIVSVPFEINISAILQKKKFNTLTLLVWGFSVVIQGLAGGRSFACGDAGKIAPPPPKIRYAAPCASQHGGGNPAQCPFFY